MNSLKLFFLSIQKNLLRNNYMRKIALFTLFLLNHLHLHSQATYESSNYASVGDVVFLTQALDLIQDFSTTGADFNWDFSSLTGNSQRRMEFKNPFSPQFLLSTIAGGLGSSDLVVDQGASFIDNLGLGIGDFHSYYEKNDNELALTGMYFFAVLGIAIAHENPELILQFPVNYGDNYSDTSLTTIGLPGIFTLQTETDKSITVDGWGSLQTPFASYSSVLRVQTVSNTTQTVTLGDTEPTSVPINSRNFSWYDPSEKVPLLSVDQINIADVWVTTQVEYLDEERDFQSVALFVYSPIPAQVNEAVQFTNTSVNSTNFSWDFGDPDSGSDNTSTESSPTHTFSSTGIYQVMLTASNDTFSDSLTIPVLVEDTSLSNDDFNLDEEFQVYPNPFSSKIKIKNPDQLGLQPKFELFNVLGQRLYKGTSIMEEDFSHLKKGTYVLSIETQNKHETHIIIKGK